MREGHTRTADLTAEEMRVSVNYGLVSSDATPPPHTYTDSGTFGTTVLST